AAKGGAGGGLQPGTDGSGDASSAGATSDGGGNGYTLTWNDSTHTLTSSPFSNAGQRSAGGGAAGYLIIRNNNAGIVPLNGASVRASYPTNAGIAKRNRRHL